MMPLSTVPVSLKEQSYDILVGSELLEAAGELLQDRFGSRHILIVTDDQVAELYLGRLRKSLLAADYDLKEIIVPAGEGSKEFGRLEMLISDILEAGVARDWLIVALGGGVVGDLAGFAASIILRGIDYLQIPTTLLAQVDSAIGGKTGINTSLGKNLVGSFHQPKLVLTDTSLLDSLPQRELLAGYAEVVKYGLLGNRSFFDWLETNGVALIEGDSGARQYAVTTCCTAKANIVGRDEQEGGARLLLNLGHTFGHALEAEVDFDLRLLHGEAVAVGTILAFDLSVRLGFCSVLTLERVRKHFEFIGLPTKFPVLQGHIWRSEQLLARMMHDKKIRKGQQTLILARGIGEAFLCREATEADILGVLRTYVG